MTTEVSTNKASTLAKIKSRQKEIATGIKEKELLLSNAHIPEDAKVTMRSELDKLRIELDDLNDEIEDIKEKVVKSAKVELSNFIKDRHICFISSESKYTWIEDMSDTKDKVNLKVWDFDYRKLINMIAQKQVTAGPERFDFLDEKDIRNVFIRAGKAYLCRTSSFDEAKWSKSKVFNILPIQRQYWAPINNGTAYDPLFDDLIYSLSGGKQENIDHLEKWVAFKYLYPEKHKTIPGLNITGKPGGNGKGMFSIILQSIFSSVNVSCVTSKALTGGFNKSMEGQVIIIFDDERKDGFPNSELKKITGNPSQVIEPKGIDAYTVDSTHNAVVIDNTGLVKLAGGGSAGEDRRWSVIDTEITVLNHLSSKHKITLSEAKEIAEVMGKLFDSRVECGKWVAAMIDKHKVRDMQVIMPLHGQDYNNRLDDQKDQFAEIFERLYPILMDQGVLPAKILSDVVESIIEKKVNGTTLDSKFREYLSRNGVKNIKKTKNAYINLTWKGEALGKRIRSNTYSINDIKSSIEFDYSTVSNSVPESKNPKLTKDTVDLRDYNIENSEFQDPEKTIATIATIAKPVTMRVPSSDSFSDSSPGAETIAQDPVFITKTTSSKEALTLLEKMKELRK